MTRRVKLRGGYLIDLDTIRISLTEHAKERFRRRFTDVYLWSPNYISTIRNLIRSGKPQRQTSRELVVLNGPAKFILVYEALTDKLIVITVMC